MLNSFDSAYHALCEEILEIGNQRMIVLIPVLFLNLVISYDLIYLRVSITYNKKYLSNLSLQNYYGLLKAIQIYNTY